MLLQRWIRTELIISVILFSQSCGNRDVYNDGITFKDEMWEANNPAKFQVEVSDTINLHNIYLIIRNTDSYPNSNLFLFITTTSPENNSLRDTLECILADEKGNWLGRGFGKVRDNLVVYKPDVRFPVKGVYKIEIQQAMRNDRLAGILNVGLRIEKAKTK